MQKGHTNARTIGSSGGEESFSRASGDRDRRGTSSQPVLRVPQLGPGLPARFVCLWFHPALCLPLSSVGLRSSFLQSWFCWYLILTCIRTLEQRESQGLAQSHSSSVTGRATRHLLRVPTLLVSPSQLCHTQGHMFEGVVTKSQLLWDTRKPQTNAY